MEAGGTIGAHAKFAMESFQMAIQTIVTFISKNAG